VGRVVGSRGEHGQGRSVATGPTAELWRAKRSQSNHRVKKNRDQTAPMCESEMRSSVRDDQPTSSRVSPRPARAEWADR
jgi:hypothetical protein